MSILVTGGTGTVGSEVVRQLAGRSESVRVMTRTIEKMNALPSGVEGVLGDMARPETLAEALSGVDRLFLLTPLSQDETEQGTNAVRAAKKAGVKRIVHMSVYRAEDIPQAPHFASKVEIHKALQESGIPHTVIMPNSFFQNDYWFKDAMLEYGIYPQPIGELGSSRVDVRDIAEASVNALLNDGFEGKRYPLVGAEAFTGPSTAEIWSRHLGRTIQYGGDDLEAWAIQAQRGLPDWMVEDLKIMYGFFQKSGFASSGDEIKQAERIIGHAPRKFEDFAAETARMWQS